MHLVRRLSPATRLTRESIRDAVQAVRTWSTSTSTASSQSAHSLDAHTAPPPIVQYLGYGGTLPFISGALASTIAADPAFFARATQLYGSSILSFLGAVHWGVALRSMSDNSVARNADFVYGVTPSLVAWSAALMQPAEGLAVLTSSFCAAYAYDYVRFGVPGSTPPWYMRLRGPLSIAAVGGCGVSYLAVKRKLARDVPSQQTVQAQEQMISEQGDDGGEAKSQLRQ